MSSVSNRKQGLKGYSWDPGFGQNTERGSGNVNGIHNLTGKRDLLKCGHNAGLGRKRFSGQRRHSGF